MLDHQVIPPTRAPCENAQLALQANPTCASAQASSEVAFDSGSPIAESDIITVCTQTCRNLISDSVVMCTDNIVSYSAIYIYIHIYTCNSYTTGMSAYIQAKHECPWYN